MWPFISYNWLFLWDSILSIFYKWGDLVLTVIFFSYPDVDYLVMVNL